MRFPDRWFPILGILLLFSFGEGGFAQTVTGAITGSVVDSSGLGVPKSEVTLIEEGSGVARETSVANSGAFQFVAVPPGVYTVTVKCPGFATVVTKNLNLTANERLAIGNLVLNPKAASETVVVTASGAAVEVESNERSSLLTGDQMQSLLSRGGNVAAYLNYLPGAVGSETEFERDFYGTHQTPSFGGVSNVANNFSVDGLSSKDIVNPNFVVNPVNVSTVAEVKVLLANYKAEYNSNGGAVVVAITKSGARQFHGGANYGFRNEALNANSYFNNLNNLARPLYRFNSFGANLGGPLFIPGKFNTGKNKLFFFYSEGVNQARQPGNLVQLTMPTALERSGDFSKTVDLNGALVKITDPTAGGTQFPQNIIPTSRINTNGQAILNLFPLPNFFDIGISHRNYNYNFQETYTKPTRQESLRLDYNMTDRLRLSFRGTTYYEGWEAYYIGGGQQWPYSRQNLLGNNPALITTLTFIPSATVVVEATLGLSGSRQEMTPAAGTDFSALDRTKLGINLPQLYPMNNPKNVAPFATFGGITGAAVINLRNDFPLRLWSDRIPYGGSVTKVQGTHTLKGGVSLEASRLNRRANAIFPGQFDFGRDTNNPFDTNWGYSNALIGNFRSYTESSSRPNIDLRDLTADWYVQDTWKVTRRLTVDYGMRFSYATPFKQANNIGANFLPSMFDRAKSVILYRPVLDSTGKRVAQNPVTGALASVSYIGAIVPNVGNPQNGMVYAGGPGVPDGFLNNPGVLYGPRLGFGWDVFGDGKTAFRAGFGTSYQYQLKTTTLTVDNLQSQPTIFNSTFATFNPAAGVTFPVSIQGLDPNIKTPTVYSYSTGIQRSISYSTLIDVAYVATLGRQFTQTENLNTLPYGTRFLTSNIDSTTKRVLPDDYLRPYLGYTSISVPRTSSSNYHSLQVQANRRFARGLQFGANWTWSKSMGYTGAYPVYLSNSLNYGKTSLDRTHTVSINWLADVPRASRVWNTRVVRATLDGWQFSGASTLQSGRPWSVGYSLVSGQDLLGGGDWARPIMLGDPTLSWGDRTKTRVFNTSVFAPPGASIGNAPIDVFRGPGRNNWDASLSKNCKLERSTLQFRWEVYNVFNHASFNAVDNTARFDALGNQVNTRFGQVTGSLTPRVMKAGLNLSF